MPTNLPDGFVPDKPANLPVGFVPDSTAHPSEAAQVSAGLPGVPRAVPSALQGKPTFAETLAATDNPGVSEGAGLAGGLAEWDKGSFGNIGAGVRDIARGQSAKGTHEILSGTGQLAAPALPLVAAGAPMATAGGAGGSLVGGALGGAVGEAAGLNPDQQKVAGDIGSIAGGAAGGYAGRAFSESSLNPLSLESARKLTSSRIQDIQRLEQLRSTAADIHDSITNLEASVKANAKAAFPDIQTPVRLSERTVESGDVDQPFRSEVEEIPFKDAQERRSNLGMEIAQEKAAVARGAKPAFDLADKVQQLRDLDARMDEAALADGKLDELNAARANWRQYMDDFHNPQSPLYKILQSDPRQVNKIIGQLQGTDSGPIALETLRDYGYDTRPIENLLTQGRTPLQISVNESGKLVRAGSEQNYVKQRLNESIDQATFNRLPSKAEARLPASAVRSRWPSIIGETPGVNAVPPRRITGLRLQSALKRIPSSDIEVK